MIEIKEPNEEFQALRLKNWEDFLLQNPSTKKCRDAIITITESGCLSSAHPSCGFYTWLLGELAIRS